MNLDVKQKLTKDTAMLAVIILLLAIIALEAYQFFLARFELNNESQASLHQVQPALEKKSLEEFSIYQQEYINLYQQHQLAKLRHYLLAEQVIIAKLQNQLASLKANPENSKQEEVSVVKNNNPSITINTPVTSEVNTINENDVSSAVNESAIKLTQRQAQTLTQIQALIRKPNTASYTVEEKKLLTVPGKNYTLQFLGTPNKEDIESLINNYHLQKQAFYFQTSYLNKTWYVLVFGEYKTYSEAIEALNKLPENLQRLRPWVRTMSSVHNAIKFNRQQG